MPKSEIERIYDEDGNLTKKECGFCRRVLFVDAYAKDSTRKDGYNRLCTPCRLYKRENGNPEAPKNGKKYPRCSECDRRKPSFAFENEGKKGWGTICSACSAKLKETRREPGDIKLKEVFNKRRKGFTRFN